MRAFRPRNHSAGFTLVELLVVIAIVSVLAALLLPAVQAARETSRRTTCLNKLRQQAMALLNYHAQNHCFPEGARRHTRAGKESIGWHVLVLPMLEQTALYDEMAPDTDGGAYYLAGSKIPDVYICPSAEPPTSDPTDNESANYVGVAGSGTSRVDWPIVEGLTGHVYNDGVLYFDSNVTVADISDGSSKTLLVGERSFFDKFEDWTFGATWYEDRDGDPMSVRVGSAKHVAWPINTIEKGRAFYARDLSVRPEYRLILSNDLSFGSRHPAGANFAFADGSVRFLQEELDLVTLQDLASRNGGELER